MTTLWYRQPAKRWLEALPIGNGRVGGMVFGGVTEERIGLNHENLWRGETRHRTTEPKHLYLPEIRRLLCEKKWVEAAELATRHLSGHDRRVQPYQPVGDLRLFCPEHETVEDYRRELDLAEAAVRVRYRVGNVGFTRTCFVSVPHQALVLHWTADQPGQITADLQLDRIADEDCRLTPWADGPVCGFVGRFPEGIEFTAAARVVATGGPVQPTGNEAARLHIEGANEALALVSFAVDWEGGPARPACEAHLAALPSDYGTLWAAHVAEYRPLFQRVELDLAGSGPVRSQARSEAECRPPGDHTAATPHATSLALRSALPTEDVPTDERLAALRGGADDPGLLSLYFQFGRYLLLSSSRSCDQPASLQGLWNEDLRPPWDSDFHHDVNLQMNYWPAEVCNLSKCAEPLFRFLESALLEGRKAARDLYDCRGIYLPITTDVWNRATPEAPGWDVWTGAAAWLAQHLWWHYEYTGDGEFLRHHAYPFLREVAAFYEDYLIRDDQPANQQTSKPPPANQQTSKPANPPQGWLVTAPSQSPENRFVGGASPVSLGIAATMDLELIHDVLTHALAASERLGMDEERRPRWRAILAEIPPLQIGRHGQLQEWLEDFEEVEPGHRHVSHLFAVYPGEQINPEDTPDLWRAARVSLERRLAAGGGHTGWSRAWTAALWARFGEGALAHEHLVHLVTDFATVSLLDLHPPEIFQIEGNLGGTAAVSEMLLQSQGGLLRILPALPPAWPEGRVRGLRARGGFEVSVAWTAGQPTQIDILSQRGGPCCLLLNPAWPPLQVQSQGPAVPTTTEAGVLRFDTRAGQRYELSPER